MNEIKTAINFLIRVVFFAVIIWLLWWLFHFIIPQYVTDPQITIALLFGLAIAIVELVQGFRV